MSRRRNQKSSLQVEQLEARDTPSAPAFAFSTGSYRAADAVPPQAQAVQHAPVFLHAPVVQGEVMCPPGGDGPNTLAMMFNHNETLVRDRRRAAKRT
jgi:hypothetical protein